jgi:hypothetical protein
VIITRFFCRICKEWNGGDVEISRHHIYKSAVFGDGKEIEVCRTPCHDALEELIREKENAILRQHPEIYEEAIKEMSGNQEMIAYYYGKIEERRRRKSIQTNNWKRRKRK